MEKDRSDPIVIVMTCLVITIPLLFLSKGFPVVQALIIVAAIMIFMIAWGLTLGNYITVDEPVHVRVEQRRRMKQDREALRRYARAISPARKDRIVPLTCSIRSSTERVSSTEDNSPLRSIALD